MTKISSQNIVMILEESYIRKIFEKKKGYYFSCFKNKKISKIEIERVSPSWAKKSCLARYKFFLNGNIQKNIRGSVKIGLSKKNSYNVSKYIYNNGFNCGKFQVPKPLDFIKNTNLFLYEEAQGSAFYEILINEKKISQVSESIENIAEWLAKLHTLSFNKEKILIGVAPFYGIKGYTKIFRKIERYYPQLSKDLIHKKDLILLDKIWRAFPFVLIHNDFYAGNIIINKENVYVIDFDKSGFGPFLMDIATFYGMMEFPKSILSPKFSQKELKKIQKIFLDAYCQNRNLNYLKVENDLKKFLAKIFLDRVFDYASFVFEGWEFLEKPIKEEYALKIKYFLKKTKEYV